MLRLLHTAVVALALCCCLLHASNASLSPGSRVLREMEAPASLGADDQVAGDEEVDNGVDGRMDLELEDYPHSGANDRHSPWGMQRRN